MPSHLSHLIDTSLCPFESLWATGEADSHSDIALDEEPCASCDDATAPGAGKPVSIVQLDDL